MLTHVRIHTRKHNFASSFWNIDLLAKVKVMNININRCEQRIFVNCNMELIVCQFLVFLGTLRPPPNILPTADQI